MAPNGLKWPKNDPKWLKIAQKWHFWNVTIYAFCQAQIFCCQAPKTVLHPWSPPQTTLLVRIKWNSISTYKRRILPSSSSPGLIVVHLWNQSIFAVGTSAYRVLKKKLRELPPPKERKVDISKLRSRRNGDTKWWKAYLRSRKSLI